MSALAIGARGSATWELACLGLPSIIISSLENQLDFERALSGDNYISIVLKKRALRMDQEDDCKTYQ